jgi:hypothetical protein
LSGYASLHLESYGQGKHSGSAGRKSPRHRCISAVEVSRLEFLSVAKVPPVPSRRNALLDIPMSSAWRRDASTLDNGMSSYTACHDAPFIAAPIPHSGHRSGVARRS